MAELKCICQSAESDNIFHILDKQTFVPTLPSNFLHKTVRGAANNPRDRNLGILHRNFILSSFDNSNFLSNFFYCFPFLGGEEERRRCNRISCRNNLPDGLNLNQLSNFGLYHKVKRSIKPDKKFLFPSRKVKLLSFYFLYYISAVNI